MNGRGQFLPNKGTHFDDLKVDELAAARRRADPRAKLMGGLGAVQLFDEFAKRPAAAGFVHSEVELLELQKVIILGMQRGYLVEPPKLFVDRSVPRGKVTVRIP